jgi:hypothetical protein
VAEPELAGLPGGELVAGGLLDLAQGIETPASLLVQIGASRLRSAGLPVPEPPVPAEAELRLYALLCERERDPYGRYNALLRELVSCERALEARPPGRDRRRDR